MPDCIIVYNTMMKHNNVYFFGIFGAAVPCTMPVRDYAAMHDYLADTLFGCAVVEWLP